MMRHTHIVSINEIRSHSMAHKVTGLLHNGSKYSRSLTNILQDKLCIANLSMIIFKEIKSQTISL